MKTFLFATDLSARSDRAFGRALALAEEHAARLLILHVVDEEQRPTVVQHLIDEARRAIEDDLAAAPAPPKTAKVEVRVEAGRDFAAIVRLAEEAAAQLIILGSHRTDTLLDLFRGTTAERVIREARAPVLLVKAPCRHPYGTVLVAVDFSVYSRRALEVAAGLLPAASFHLLHAFRVPFSGFISSRDTRDQLRDEHLQQLSDLIEEELNSLARRKLPLPRTVEKIVREGEVQPVIREEVERLKPDLLVVGTHGRTGVSHALLGSVAEAMLRTPPCDVLAVKAW